MPSKGRLASVIGPWRLIWLSIQVHFRVVLEAFQRDGISFIFQPRRIRDVAATQLLNDTSEGFIAYEDTTVVPSLVRQAHGRIIEIGTGPGNQMERYDPAIVECIYGVDPNPRFGDAIAKRLNRHKLLDGKYRFVACGIEDSDILETEGIAEGSMDTVISIQSLCAVGHVEAVMRQAHRLLRPGGSFIFWEHQRSQDALTRIVQASWNPAWSGLVGCNMDRDIKASILAAGGWENPEGIEADDDPHTCLPRIWGVLKKKVT